MRAAKGQSGVGFSDATRKVWVTLKREIAGLGLLDRLLLWGFERCFCPVPGLTAQVGRARWP
jgi:hypothetical protein